MIILPILTLFISVPTLSIIFSTPQPINYSQNQSREITSGGQSIQSVSNRTHTLEATTSTGTLNEESISPVQDDLHFPAGFDPLNKIERDGMYRLAWFMCDSYRRAVLALKKKPFQASPGGNMGPESDEESRETNRLRLHISNHPMEPKYHLTCVELFRRYPDLI